MENKEKKNIHIPQEPHDIEDCRINERPHNHPDCDCGHYVATGPATGKMLDDNGNLVNASEAFGPGVN